MTDNFKRYREYIELCGGLPDDNEHGNLDKYYCIELMRRGKGNPDWLCSAPHGAGRIMSRKQAMENLKLEDFQNSMEGIYTTSVCEETIDEAPMVYKPYKQIMKDIEPTVEIVKVIKPIYNFKAKNA